MNTLKFRLRLFLPLVILFLFCSGTAFATTYAFNPSLRNVTLDATHGAAGANQSFEAIIPPAANFGYVQNEPYAAPFAVQFNSSSSTGDIVNYSWNFGDSTTSTEANPLHTYTSCGTKTVTLTLTGPTGGGTSAITLYPQVLARPIVNAGGDVTQNEGTTFTLQNSASASDADGTYTVAWTEDPASPYINITSGATTLTPTISILDVQEGTGKVSATLRLTAIDDNGLPASDTMVININQPPVLTSPGNKPVAETATLAFTLAATDPESGSLTYSFTSLPTITTNAPTLNSSTGAFSWTPNYDQAGTYTFTFKVEDNGTPKLSDTKTVTVTVSNTNQAPVLTVPSSPQPVAETANLAFTLTATDSHDSPTTLTYSFTSVPVITANAPTLGSSNGQFSWTPNYDQAGTYTFTFKVEDNGTPKLSDTKTVTVTVSNTNQAPVLTVPSSPQPVAETANLAFTLTATDSHDSPTTLTYSFTSVPVITANAPTLGSSNGQFSWTPNYDQAGTYTFTFKVEDNGTPKLSDTKTVTVTVSNTNRIPTVNPGTNQTVPQGGPVTLLGSVSDPDGNGTLSSATWSQVIEAGDPTVTPIPAGDSTPTAPKATFTAPNQSRALKFRLTAIDNEGGQAFADVVITVNMLPMVEAGNTLTKNEAGSFAISNGYATASDPDGPIPSVDWKWVKELSVPNNLPDNSVTIQNANTLTPTITLPDVDYGGPGRATVTLKLTATDNKSMSSSDTLIITVNQPPVAEAGENLTGSASDTITLDGRASHDPDGTIKSYTWTQTPAPNGTLTNNGDGTATFTPPTIVDETTFTFSLMVTDNDDCPSLTADSVSVTLSAPPNIYYVDQARGNDSWNGTQTYPLKTITAALAKAATSIANTIEVLGTGAYNENVTMVEGKTLKANSRRGPAITGNVTMANGSTLEGFRISGKVLASSVHDAAIAYNTIKLGNDTPTMEISESYRVSIHNNIILNRHSANNITAMAVKIYDSGYIEDPEEPSHYNVITLVNNTIDVTETSSNSSSKAYGIYIDADNKYDMGSGATALLLENNIIYFYSKNTNKKSFCIYKEARNKTSVPVKYNAFYPDPAGVGTPTPIEKKQEVYIQNGYIVLNPVGAPVGTNKKYGEVLPLFVTPDLTESFRLDEDSPCINTGDPNDPINGEPILEPDGTRVNMGAYGNTDEAEVKAANVMPMSALDSIVPDSPKEGEEIFFDDPAFDSDGTIVQYEWTSDKNGVFGTPTEDIFTYADLSFGKHVITVRVQDNEGKWSLPSDEKTVIVGVPKVTAVGLAGGIELTIEDHANSEDYHVIEKKESGELGWHEAATFASAPNTQGTFTWTDRGVDPYRTYCYRVKAVKNDPAETVYSEEVVEKVISAAPYAPNDVKLEVITDSAGARVVISWQENAAAVVDGYRIYRSAKAEEFGSLIADITPTIYNDTAALPAHTYYYRIIAYNGSNESSSSYAAGITLNSNISPTVSMLPVAGNILRKGAAAITVNAFDNENDTIAMRIECKRSGDDEWQTFDLFVTDADTEVRNCDLSGVEPGSDYAVRVIGIDNNPEPRAEYVIDGITIAGEDQTVVSDISNLQNAINNATEGDTILLNGNRDYSLTSNIDITKSVRLVGANQNSTGIILGNYCITVGSSKNVTLEGLAIKGYTGVNPDKCAIVNYGTLTLKGCEVTGNKGLAASAINCRDASMLYLENTLIVGNENIVGDINKYVADYGGRHYAGTIVFSSGARASIKNSTIADNINSSGVSYAAILHCSTNSITIENSVMWDNNGGCDFKTYNDRIPSCYSINVTSSDIQQLTGGSTISTNQYTEGANVIHLIPQFVDVGTDNYNIDATSPAADMGSYITPAPVAGFSVTGFDEMTPLTAYFIDKSEGSVTSRKWDFGDGVTSAEQYPRHTYSDYSAHTVTLTVTGPGGSDVKVASIQPPAPVADFTATPASGIAPLAVNFRDTSTGVTGIWSWNFGDGGISTEQSPIHTYTTPGTYTVSLTVTGPGGSNTKTITDCITATSCTGTGMISANVAFTSYPDIKIPGIEVKLWKKEIEDTEYTLYATMITSDIGVCLFKNLPLKFPTSSTSSTSYKVTTVPQAGYAAYGSGDITFYHPAWPESGYVGLMLDNVRLTRVTLNKGVIAGCVTSAETAVPLANINVELWKRSYTDLDFVLLQSVATNTIGGYSFASLPEIFYHNAPQAILYKVKVATGAGYEVYEGEQLKFYNGMPNWVDAVQNNIALTPIPVVINASVIQDAINAASPGDTIILSDGVYGLTSQLNITKNLTIKAIDPDKTTIVLGNYSIFVKDSACYNNNEAYYLLFQNLNDVTLENLTIKGYRGQSNQGAIQNFSGKLTLKNCKVIDNEGIRVGAIYSCWKSKLVLENTLVADNKNPRATSTSPYTWTSGGVAYCGTIYLNGLTTLELRNTTIAGNINESAPITILTGKIIPVEYGAIYRHWGETMTMSDSIIWGNGIHPQDFSQRPGAGQGPVTVTSCDIESLTIPGNGQLTSEGLIHEDPEFQSPEEGDYTPLNVDCLSMGSRFNESTQSQAIQSAIDSATKGTNIILFPDTYTLSEQLKITKNITIKGSDPENTILQLGNNNILVKDSLYMAQNEAYYQLYDNLTDVNLENLTITGYTGTNPLGPIEAYVRNYLTLKNCKLVGNKGTRVSGIYYGGTYLWTDATKTALWKTGGVKLVNTLVAGNITEEGHGYDGPYFPAITTEGTTAYHSGRGVIYGNGGKLEVYNSTIAGNLNNSSPTKKVKYGAMFLKTARLTMENSIMWNNGLDRNDVYLYGSGSVGGATYSDVEQESITGTGVINEDPLFNENYTPQNPACIGTGSNGADMGAGF